MAMAVKCKLVLAMLAQVALTAVLCWFNVPTLTDIRLMKGQCSSILRIIPPEERYWVTESTLLAYRSPRADAISSIILGDYRLVGMAGLGLFYPGTPDMRREYLVWPQKTIESTRIVLGVGDSWHSQYDYLYQSVSYQYAERYNAIMWPFFKRNLCKGA
jgi:hypothetical protein